MGSFFLFYELFKTIGPAILKIAKGLVAIVLSGFIGIVAWGGFTGNSIEKPLKTYTCILKKGGGLSFSAGKNVYQFLEKHKEGFLPRTSLLNFVKNDRGEK